MRKENYRGRNAKGYYIALGLCAVAIGISGYLYYDNASSKDPQLQDPDTNVGATYEPNETLEVGATGPQAVTPTTSDPTKPQTETKPLQTASPVRGETAAEYAMDCLSYNQTTRDWRVHDGVDIAAEAGTQVCAAAEGTVYTVFSDEAMGMTVVIRHDGGYTTQYSSLAEEVSVKAGDHVTLGQAIGCVGRTALLESAIGDHVHFSVTKDDQPVDPKDFLAME